LITPELRGPSYHTLLVVNIVIQEKLIKEKKLSLCKENDEKKAFIDQIWTKFRSVNTLDIKDTQSLEDTVVIFVQITKLSWNVHMK